MKGTEMNFEYFDKRKLGREERKFLKEKNFEVLVFPNVLNKKNLLGYAVKKEIVFVDELEGKEIIMIKKGLSPLETKRTFWHEVAHFWLREKGLDKDMRKLEKERYCESIAMFKSQGGTK